MDLTKFSTDDLLALQSGDLTKVSTPGLKILKSQQFIDKLKREQPAEYDPNSKEWQDKYNPTNGMNSGQKFLAGAGKAFADLGRGVQQLNPFADNNQADIDEAKRQDAPLMKTKAGLAGNIAGNVAIALPTTFIPGAQTLGGAAAVGAAQGFIQPVASDESRLKNTLIGGVAAPVGIALGRGAVAAAKGGKALVEPFTQAGRDAIAGRTLQRFGVEAADVAGASGKPTVTGAVPTLAEQIARPEGAAGAARLQDAVRALDPEVAGKFVAREAENNAARVNTLKDLAGEGGARDFAEAMRNGTAKELYAKAFETPMNPGLLSAAERGEVTKLLKVPAIQDAMKSAKEIAANQGMNISKPGGSIEGLHLTKLALDDAIQAASAGGSAAAINKAMSIKAARDRLLTFMDRMSPGYGEARATYAAMSKPLNQADVAAEVLKKGTASTADLAGNARLMPNAVGNVMKDEGKLIKNATGRDLGTSKLSDLLDPQQLQKLTAVAKEVDRAAAVGRAANGPGSATAQRLSSQNILRQILGPTGLPESWAESTLLNTAMRPVQFAYSGVAEPKIQSTLAELILNPEKAALALKAANPTERAMLVKVLKNPELARTVKAALPAAAVSSER